MSIIINIKQISDISAVQCRVAETVSAPTRDGLGSGPGPCRGGEGLCRGGGGWRDGVAVLAGTVAVVGGTVAVRPGTVTVWPGSVTGWGSRPGYRGHAKTPSIIDDLLILSKATVM